MSLNDAEVLAYAVPCRAMQVSGDPLALAGQTKFFRVVAWEVSATNRSVALWFAFARAARVGEPPPARFHGVNGGGNGVCVLRRLARW